MNQPTSTTRFIGTPRIAGVLYVGLALLVVGWAGGAVPWWLGIVALCSAGTVRKAVQDVRRYDQWWASWQAMGNSAPRSAAPRPQARKRKMIAPWAGVVIAAVSLVLIAVVMAAPGTDAALRQALTLLWCGDVLYLGWKLVARLRRSVVRSAGTARAGRSKETSPEVVEWVLPRASSSPSRADAMRRLPEYSARLLQ
jgi:hypothetical protein